MTCHRCYLPAKRGGLCDRHWSALVRGVDNTLFMRRLGEELRARKVHELLLGSLGWMLAGDAAWRAAIAANPGFIGANGRSLDGTIGSEPEEVRPPPGSSPTPDRTRSEHGEE